MSRKLAKLAAPTTGSIDVPDSVVRMMLLLMGVLVTATLVAAIMQSIATAGEIQCCVTMESASPAVAPKKKSGHFLRDD